MESSSITRSEYRKCQNLSLLVDSNDMVLSDSQLYCGDVLTLFGNEVLGSLFKSKGYFAKRDFDQALSNIDDVIDHKNPVFTEYAVVTKGLILAEIGDCTNSLEIFDAKWKDDTLKNYFFFPYLTMLYNCDKDRKVIDVGRDGLVIPVLNYEDSAYVYEMIGFSLVNLDSVDLGCQCLQKAYKMAPKSRGRAQEFVTKNCR